MSAAREIVEHEKKVKAALARIYSKSRWEPSDDKTPLDVLMEAEEGTLDEWSYKAEVTKRLFEFFVQDGIEPWNVLRNVYAVAIHMRFEPWVHLNVRDRGLLFGDSHGSHHFRMQKVVNVLRRQGAKSWKAPGQKGLESHSSYSDAQKGNTNRRRNPTRLRHRRLKQKLRRQTNGQHKP